MVELYNDHAPKARTRDVREILQDLIHGHFILDLQELCNTYELELGKVLKAPMKGLIEFHS